MVYQFASIDVLQKDIDDGWKDWCSEHICYWTKVYNATIGESRRQMYLKMIKHFKVLRRMR